MDKKSRLASLHQSLESGNAVQLVEALAKCLNWVEGWVDQFRSTCLIDPSHMDEGRWARLGCLAEAVELEPPSGIESKSWMHLRHLVASNWILAEKTQRIADQLRTTDLLSVGIPDLYYAFGVFIEEQSRSVSQKLTSEGAFLDPVAAVVQSLPMRDGEVGMSPADHSDALGDIADLIFRFALFEHRRRGEQHLAEVLSAPLSFDKMERSEWPLQMEYLINLAGIHLATMEIWEHVRFGDWLARDMDGGVAFGTGNGDYVRQQAMLTRFVFNLSQTSTLYGMVPLHYRKAIEQLAKLSRMPDEDATWHLTIDIRLLRIIQQESPFRDLWFDAISAEHCQPLIPKIHFKEPGAEVDFELISTARFLVADLLTLFRLKRGGSDGSANPTHVVALRSLSYLLRRLTGCSEKQAALALRLITYDPSRREFDIWGHPLLRLDTDRVLLVSSLIQSANPIPIIEDLYRLATKQKNLGVRSEDFERAMQSLFVRNAPESRSAQGKLVKTPDGKIEFDVVVFWEGHLLLLETKCVKYVGSPADRSIAWGDVRYSVDQLKSRKRAVLEHWNLIRAALPELSLPESINASRVHCISVSNTFDFTGIEVDDVVVTDDSVLRRYFEAPEIERFEWSSTEFSEVGTVGFIRHPGPPNVQGLLGYLHNPPQVRAFVECTTLGWRSIPRITQDDTPILYLTDEFNSTIDDLAIRHCLG